MRSLSAAPPDFSAGDRELLERVKRVVRAVEPGARVILYGSRARADAAADSDWDLLILLDGPVDHTRADALHDRIYELELSEDECPVLSTIVRGKGEWNSPLYDAMPLRTNVEREGIEL
jgi:predicted nucleotidyltransferase